MKMLSLSERKAKKAGSKNGSDEGVGLQQEAPPRGYNKGNE